jgi:hypothetical protein
MWFAGLMIAFCVGGLLYLAARRKAGLADWERLLLALVLPAAWAALVFPHVSDSRFLIVANLSIPLALGMCLFLVNLARERGGSPWLASAVLVLFLGPLYAATARADWNFTYFDLPPDELTHTIEQGAARGIQTNEVFHDIAGWIEQKAAAHAEPGEFAIFMDRVPMGHALTRLRPALNHSWIGYARSGRLRSDSVDYMIAEGRHPAVAFRFLRAPMYLPQKRGGVTLGNKLRYHPEEPISAYMRKHMRLEDKFTVNREPWLEFWVAKQTP